MAITAPMAIAGHLTSAPLRLLGAFWRRHSVRVARLTAPRYGQWEA